jgi:hypothetical protein
MNEEAVREQVDEATLDEAVYRILYSHAKLGIL